MSQTEVYGVPITNTTRLTISATVYKSNTAASRSFHKLLRQASGQDIVKNVTQQQRASYTIFSPTFAYRCATHPDETVSLVFCRKLSE